MVCKKCGTINEDHAKFCAVCGAAQQTSLSPVSNTEPGAQVGFVDAVKLFFKNYTNFKGRARRSEYWWVILFNFLVSALISAILPEVAFVWSIAIFVPSLALCVRRLHDIGRSGWWYLLLLLPLAGSIILLIWFCKDSDSNANQWGPSPKY